RARRAPGCFASREQPIPAMRARKRRLSWAVFAFEPPRGTLPILLATAPPPELPISQIQNPALVQGGSPGRASHRAARNRAKCIHVAGRNALCAHVRSKRGSPLRLRQLLLQTPAAHARCPLCPSKPECRRPSLPSLARPPAPAKYPNHESSNRRSRRRLGCAVRKLQAGALQKTAAG